MSYWDRKRDCMVRRRLWASGFTLMEILVALCVVLLAIVPLIRLHCLSMAQLDSGRQMARATLLANARLAEIIAGDVPELGTSKGSVEDPESGAVLLWTSAVSEARLPELEAAGLRGIREVRVGVTWADGRREATVEVCTLVHVAGYQDIEGSDHSADTDDRPGTRTRRTGI